MAEPLRAGTVLSERFEIESVLGSGGFSVVYLGYDLIRKDRVVVKELAPGDARRSEAGMLDLGADSHRLRRKFMEEGALQQRLRLPGMVPVRSWFSEKGTAYVVLDHLPQARTLDSLLRARHVLPPEEALIFFYALLDIVEGIHSKGVLHRDIKPSNVLVVESSSSVWLIDFGAAREWQSSAHTQTVLFTPGFAPPEQLSEKAKRGPATDIYALCATLYQMLLGQPPPPVSDRAAGIEPDLTGIALAAGPRIAHAIEVGLALKMGDRPQTIQELRDILQGAGEDHQEYDLRGLDDLLHRSQHFAYRKRQCPSCGGVLSEPHPLRRGVCPVCREGRIEHREIHEKLCPVCKAGILHRHKRGPLPVLCDVCNLGVLHYRRHGLLSGEKVATCPKCEAVSHYTKTGERISHAGDEPSTPRIERSDVVWVCDVCSAQLDEQPDSRLKLIEPAPVRWTTLYPDEWARVAVGLDPGAGNAECANCGAEYYLEGQNVTLLGAHHDPNGFVADYAGRRLQVDDLRWLGVGKSSPHRGFVCEDCGTEFDFAGLGLLLVATKNRKLCTHTEECRSLEEWHRVAQGLPSIEEIGSLEAAVPEALRVAYIEGQVGFEGRTELLWKGPAIRSDSDQEANLTVDLDEITFGGLLRKWKVRTGDLTNCEATPESLTLSVRGEEDPVTFELHPMEFTAHLASRSYTVALTAEDLCHRLRG